MINPTELAIVLFSLIITLALPGLGVLFAFIALFAYLLIGDRRKKFESVGFNRPKNWVSLILITLVFGIILELGFQSIVEPVIEKSLGFKLDLSNLDSIKGDPFKYMLLLAIGWLVGGFLEEVLFRGFLLDRISQLFNNRKLGNILAILITSTVLGLAHMYQGYPGVIATGLISVILGVVYVHSNKVLWYSVFIHGFNNTVGITIIYLDLEKTVSNFFY
ncbi:CPBP family intramembrane metalloprotease [Hyphobacterium sp. CCMP332]|nr:CPBP family intramembrane metalloprotease [Hyphobacterium sp. CCMP332]